MKRIKRLIINVVAVVMLVSACFGLTACKDIRTLELTVQVYDYSEKVSKTVTMNVDLYGHLAPKTVDAISSYVKDGYYDNAVFYQLEGYSSQVMLGDFIVKDGELAQNSIKPELPGEFVRGGTVGSNLVSKKGSVGLWRNWYAHDGSYKANNALGSGRATWYLPTGTSEITDYNEWFCVFAQIDITDADNASALSLISNSFGSDATVEEYVVYYTGEYDAEKANENYGLEYHCVLEPLFDEEEIDDLFVAEGAEYTAFNHHTIKISKIPGEDTIATKIVSAKMK